MARVFVSWGNPDEDVVTKLVKTLRGGGIDLFEYSEDMRSGDQIHNRVLDEIDRAEVAVLCLSDRSVDRDWVQRECDWCFYRLMNQDRPLKRLIVVEVGPLSESKVPSILKEAWLHRFSVHEHGDIDGGIGKLLEHVLNALGGSPPLFVPATIFAMTRKQLGALLLGASAWAPLRSLGQRLGMAWQEDPRPSLLERYGEHCLDFRPFKSEKSLKDIIQETVDKINQHRSANRPVHVMWYSPNNLLEHMYRQGHYWEHFDNTKHTIFIDSISVLHPEVKKDFDDVLGSLSGGVDWRALTWIPPYTQHTRVIEELILDATKSAAPLVNEFHRWRGKPGCFCSFDAYTESGFQHWLWHALAHLSSGRHPEAGSLNEIRAHQAGPSHLPSRPTSRYGSWRQ